MSDGMFLLKYCKFDFHWFKKQKAVECDKVYI